MRSLTRWNPRDELEMLDPFQALEQMLGEMWSGRPRYESETARPMLRPAMDVIEGENDLTIRIDLPGIQPDDVKVETEDNILTVSGEMGDTIQHEGDRYHYRERRYGAFQRRVRLPNTLDSEKVDAAFDNGVLTITLPKQPQAQPKQIEVKSKGK